MAETQAASGDTNIKVVLPVTGMTCANCVAAIERTLKKLGAVSRVAVNLATGRVLVEYDASVLTIHSLIARIKRAGYGVVTSETEFAVPGISDAVDMERLANELNNINGVLFVKPFMVSKTVRVEYVPTVVTQAFLRDLLLSKGFQVLESGQEEDVETKARALELKEHAEYLIVSACLTIPLFFMSMAHDLGFFHVSASYMSVFQWIMCALATPVQFYVGMPHYLNAYHALRNGTANMDVLVVLGSSAAYLYSIPVLLGLVNGHVYFETSALIITLIRLGKFLETRARGKTSEAIRKLAALRPKKALVIRGEEELSLAVDEVLVGDVVVVRPGDRVPLDGVVLEGRSNINEAMLTGEPMPVSKTKGDRVFAGTLNMDGLLKIEVTAASRETALARIIRLVEDAQVNKASIQRIADEISAVFVPVVLFIAAVTFIAWLYLPEQALSEGLFSRALMNTVAVLLVACPCAMGLATPTAIVVGTGLAAERGVLFRTAEALERMARVSWVVMDKTGTVTKGQPSVVNVVVALQVSAPNSPVAEIQREQMRVLGLAASLEKGSTHPIAVAVLEEAERLKLALVEAQEIQVEAGLGVKGRVNGRQVLLGNERMMVTYQVAFDSLRGEAERLQSEGKTVIFVAEDDKAVGLLALSDSLKEDAKEAVAKLRELGLKVFLLTGDNARSARQVAEALGISDVKAEAMPETKISEIQRLQAQGDKVAMVGDGINDAPALAQADVGIAIGAGADVASAAASVTLISNELMNVYRAFVIARRTMKTIRQNLFWALFYNVLLIPAAALGFLNPVIAAGAMAFSSLFVVTNSLRLKKIRMGDRPVAPTVV